MEGSVAAGGLKHATSQVPSPRSCSRSRGHDHDHDRLAADRAMVAMSDRIRKQGKPAGVTFA